MSGLLVQLVRPLAKMVSATRVPINHATCVRPMGPTDLLASWIDRSYHLLLLQLRFGRWANPPVGRISQLRGGSDLGIALGIDLGIDPRTVVTLSCRHQLPGDAGGLVGQRHGRQLRRLALDQFE